MSHDKIRAAARKRMAETGEPYTTARREVIRKYQEAGAEPDDPSSSSAAWFAINYSDMDRFSLWLDARLGGGPGRAGVEVDSAVLRVRMGDFHLDIPRGSVRSAGRSDHQTRGTIGVHGRRGPWLVNGSHDDGRAGKRRSDDGAGACGASRRSGAVTTITPYRSPVPDGRDGFPQLLHAEWTKFRTVRGWVIGTIVAILVTAGIRLFFVTASANVSCQGQGGPTQHGAACQSALLLGPGGEPAS